jgi:hypothetical protein
MKRVKHPVSLELAEQRLITFRASYGPGPHKANTLADVIWKREDADFNTTQGAGAAATRVLKKLGCEYVITGEYGRQQWGWSLANL